MTFQEMVEILKDQKEKRHYTFFGIADKAGVGEGVTERLMCAQGGSGVDRLNKVAGAFGLELMLIPKGTFCVTKEESVQPLWKQVRQAVDPMMNFSAVARDLEIPYTFILKLQNGLPDLIVNFEKLMKYLGYGVTLKKLEKSSMEGKN